MRVLFVTHNVPRHAGDAAGSFILRLATALQAHGHRVEIVAPGAPSQCGSECVEDVLIHRVRYADEADMTLAYTGTMVEQVQRSWRARWALLGLLAALRRETARRVTQAAGTAHPVDIVHVHWWFPAGLALWRLAALRTVGRVLTMHGSDVRLGQRSTLTRAIMRAVLRPFAVRTTVSSWLSSRVELACPGAQALVAPMPVDLRHFTPPAPDVYRDGALFVGRLNAQKGLADLLIAMSRPALAALTLDVIGDGPAHASLLALATSLGVADRVRWHGALPQPALVPFYQRTRAVVIPSREEGLGLVAVEAQLCGAPVVAYASGGLVDVVQPTCGGSLVPPGDLDALAAAVAQCVGSEQEADLRGHAGREGMLAQFSPEAVAVRYQQLYEKARDAARQVVA